jgi:hypothetical protein
MRDIPLAIPVDKLPTYSLLNYGDTRTGKTYFAATWPRPYIYADVAESGHRTIMTMDRNEWFEPDVEPMVVGIDQMNDVSQDQARLDALVKSGRIKTIVFDAFTFYADFFLAALIRVKPTADNRQIYGDLGKHLREIRNMLGSKGTNVVYNMLAKHPDTDDPKGRPLIPGKESDKYSATVDFLWHSRVQQKIEAGKIVDEIRERRTRQYNAYIAGHRLGVDAALLPDPFTGNYTEFITALGYDVEAIRKSLPAVGALSPLPSSLNKFRRRVRRQRSLRDPRLGLFRLRRSTRPQGGPSSRKARASWQKRKRSRISKSNWISPPSMHGTASNVRSFQQVTTR